MMTRTPAGWVVSILALAGTIVVVTALLVLFLKVTGT